MKTLQKLTAETGEAQFPARGVVTEMQYEDPQCGGWFVGLALTTSGLRFKTRRNDSSALMIPLDELIALARQHAPEIFANDEARANLARARSVQERRPPSAAAPSLPASTHH